MRPASLVLAALSSLALATATGALAAQPAEPVPAPTAPAPEPTAVPATDPAASQPAPMIPVAPAPSPPPALPPSPSFMSIDPIGHPVSLADDRSPPPFDWMAPAGATSLGIGAAFALSGAIVLGTKGGGQQCGRDGCVDRPDYLADNTGGSLLGAGAGFALVGGITLLTGYTVVPGPGDRRSSQPLMVTGIGLTSLSAAGLGLSIAQARTYDPGKVDFTSAWPVMLVSGMAAASGIPMLVIGADIDTPEDREAERMKNAAPANGERHSVPMMVTGGILTGIGGVAGLVGTGISIFGLTEGGEFGPIYTMIIGLPVIGGGGIFTAIGVPILCAGARRDAPNESASSPPPAWLVPEVELGPTGFSSTWRF
jgi:hypothetical protein